MTAVKPTPTHEAAVFAALCFDLHHGAVPFRHRTAYAVTEALAKSTHAPVLEAVRATRRELLACTLHEVPQSALAPMLFAAWSCRDPLLPVVVGDYQWRCASTRDRKATETAERMPTGRQDAREAKVLAVLESSPSWFPVAWIVAKTGLSKSMVEIILRELRRTGQAASIGKAGSVKWAAAGVPVPRSEPDVPRSIKCAGVIMDYIRSRPGEPVPWIAIEEECTKHGYAPRLTAWVRSQLVQRGEIVITGSVIKFASLAG